MLVVTDKLAGRMGSRAITRVVRENEGQRLLVKALEGEGLSLNAARLALGLGVGVINHWVKGTGKPDGPRRGLLRQRFGVPFEAWDAEVSSP